MHSMIITPNPLDPEIVTLTKEFEKQGYGVNYFIPSTITVKINVSKFENYFVNLNPKGILVRGFGVDELLRMFTLLLYEQNLVVFLVLDEIDYLLPEERTDFLYALSRLEESPIVREEYGFLDNKVESRLNLLTITRDKNFRYYLDSSTASSLGQNLITFHQSSSPSQGDGEKSLSYPKHWGIIDS